MIKRIYTSLLLVLVLLGLTGTAQAVTRNINLYIIAGSVTITGNGGTTMAAWSYSDVPGTPKVPGLKITANEGDTVNITVTNNHTLSHNFVIKGITTDITAIPAGGNRVYSFTASNSGTYLYSDTLNADANNNNVNREMGMYGVLIVAPTNGANTVWTNGPAFSWERTWVVSEMDKTRWNDVAGAGKAVNTAVYKPNYFLINGRGGFDGMMAADTTIDGSKGQTALIRIVNAGQFSHSLHFHSNHFQVVRVNNVPKTAPFQELDVMNVPPMSTVDILYYLNQLGDYPMHIHTAQMETANGVYLNGVASMIHIR